MVRRNYTGKGWLMRIIGEEAQLAKTSQLVSKKLGVISTIRRGNSLAADPSIVSYSASTCDPSAFSPDAMPHLAGGAGLGWRSAFMATVGEGVERYGSGFYKIDALKLSTANQLDQSGLEYVYPAEFSLFHEQQYSRPGFPFVPFTDQTEVYWDLAYDITSGKNVYCPAVFLYMPFRVDPALISEQISTGFATHTDPKKALLSSIYEVIERDAFMIHWANLLPGKKIRISGETAELVHQIIPQHFGVHLFDITTDIGIPVVMGIMEGVHDFGPFMVVCAAARATLREAVNKTVVEMCQSVPYYRNLLITDETFENFENIKSFSDHAIFYVKRPELREVFDIWLNQEPFQAVIDEPERSQDDQLRNIITRFRENKLRLLVKDKTTPDLADAGFSLQRAVAPSLVHLNGAYGAYYLGGDRLYNAPGRMGYDLKNTYNSLNQLPHPFP